MVRGTPIQGAARPGSGSSCRSGGRRSPHRRPSNSSPERGGGPAASRWRGISAHRRRSACGEADTPPSGFACHLPSKGWTGVAMDFITILSIFVLACFVGYYVVWSVTPALHTPLMAVTNAISSVIIVGALIAAAAAGAPGAKWLGLLAVVVASVNIFGGFAGTARMLAMYKKKERR